MKPTAFLLAFWLLPLQGSSPEEMTVRDAEAAMRQRPREAFLIARQAAATLVPQPALVQRLLKEAAHQQEAHLILLEEPQVADLADYYSGPLGDRAAAARVQRRWLRLRREALGPGKSTERLQLARLAWKWLKDRELAADLCLEALQANPDLTAATHMLHEELAYRWTDKGWVRQEQKSSTLTSIRAGMTPAEVRQLKGAPERIARQHVNRRYLEQWIYDHPTPLWVEFHGVKGQEPRVVQVHPLPR